MKEKVDPRHRSRIIALQALFEWSFNSSEISDLVKRDLVEYSNIDKQAGDQVEADEKLSLELTEGVTQNLDEIDEIITSCAPEWPLNQIAKVDLEILRIAIFELYLAKNVPPKVAIDEAVELAKEFGGENSSKFVNGVLGTVVKKLLPEVMKEEKND